MPTTNDRLRDALLTRNLTVHEVAATLEVDPTTAERWITTGRAPYPRYRHQLAALVGQSEAYLWPDALTKDQQDALTKDQQVAVTDSEVVRVYPHRASVPGVLWQQLFEATTERIEILVYSGIWLPDQNPRLAALLRKKATAGVEVRILLGDPDSDEVMRRGEEEGIGDAMASKVRNVLVHYRDLADADNVEVRLHATTLYNSLYRFDDELLTNAHIYGFPAAHAPVLHLRRLSSGVLFETYADSFAKVWVDARPAWPPAR